MQRYSNTALSNWSVVLNFSHQIKAHIKVNEQHFCTSPIPRVSLVAQRSWLRSVPIGLFARRRLQPSSCPSLHRRRQKNLQKKCNNHRPIYTWRQHEFVKKQEGKTRQFWGHMLVVKKNKQLVGTVVFGHNFPFSWLRRTSTLRRDLLRCFWRETFQNI